MRLENDSRAEIGRGVGIVVPHRVANGPQAKGLRGFGMRADVVAARLDGGGELALGGELLHLTQAVVVGVRLILSGRVGRIVRRVGGDDRAAQCFVIGGGFRRLGRSRIASAKTNQRRQEREFAHGMTLRGKWLTNGRK